MEKNKLFLVEEIQGDMDLREESLLRIKTLPKKLTLPPDKRFIYTYSIPIVYSLWEGFVTTSFATYIREINKLNLKPEEICDPILIYHCEREFPQLRNYPTKPASKTKFLRDLQNFYCSDNFTITSIVDTKSNVNFLTLNGLLESFNLETIEDCPEKGSGYLFSNELSNFLVKLRNAIAHGDILSVRIGEKDLERAVVVVQKLMPIVRDRIQQGFSEKRYLKNKNVY